MNQLISELEGNYLEYLTNVFTIINNSITISNLSRIKNVLSYHFKHKGHMIRPMLVYISTKLATLAVPQQINRKTAYLSASIELLHNASLVHDDVLDNERTRRQAKCLHRVFGQKNAILAGNIYYIKAIELSVLHLEPSQTSSLLKTATDMCSGEILQQQYEGKSTPEIIYLEIIRKKTASLTALACREAARIAGAPPETAADLGRLGELIGIVYQLLDDHRDRDVRLDEGFDLDCHLRTCAGLFEGTIGRYGNSRYAQVFRELMEALLAEAGYATHPVWS
ncbi:MAG: polyprenyl synthetase family protein [Patescibacteria group bacterium]